MKRYFFPIVLVVVSFVACYKSKNKELLNGLWKIDRVEVLKGPELKKIIDTDCQYWNISDGSGIEIFDTIEMQNILRIKLDKDSINSIDPGSGRILDKFVIQKLNRNKLELSSRQQLNTGVYSIVYYLDKVNDTIAAEIKEGF